ncbi:alpha/beta fold hydrolase [Jidongwangia harbinensis]|uniref:alpha/beta fold hydrolase n=1 Tax=Jidongwangia harbinensis TaxID=2878561 RepID=UPI001CD96C20|nr:alpha/beta hydrolase [Jidongwangia harbinensis]MCA2211569.1 alpha/beta hydrolase [Jidongwangia harbinensis]
MPHDRGQAVDDAAWNRPHEGVPVLLVHGNGSSAEYWLPLIRRLPDSVRVVAPHLRGYGRSEAAPVDATRGLRDFADDLAALLDDRDLFPRGGPVIVAAHSMGCGVAMQMIADHPDRFTSALLESPMSPYGFGGTRGLDGTPATADFAGTGGGGAHPDFVARIEAGDRSAEARASPLSVLRSRYVADPASLGDDEELLLNRCSVWRSVTTATRATAGRRPAGRSSGPATVASSTPCHPSTSTSPTLWSARRRNRRSSGCAATGT